MIVIVMAVLLWSLLLGVVDVAMSSLLLTALAFFVCPRSRHNDSRYAPQHVNTISLVKDT